MFLDEIVVSAVGPIVNADADCRYAMLVRSIVSLRWTWFLTVIADLRSHYSHFTYSERLAPTIIALGTTPLLLHTPAIHSAPSSISASDVRTLRRAHSSQSII